jgi:hypothetical protein
MKTFQKIFGTFTCLLLLWACSNSDQYLIDSQDIQEIEVSAYITNSFENEAEKRRSDTIQPGDSLIFISDILPSKSIRNLTYYWTIDGDLFANEYSFKKDIETPGVHQIAFVFVDFLGDTLSDTLSISVASPPELDTEHFIPASKTQNINSDNALYFAWNANDPDSMWKLSYRFTLKDTNDTLLVDTILDQAYFAYYNGLKPLQKYTWTVTAFNEVLLKSEADIVADFYTNGRSNENAILGIVRTNSEENLYDYTVTLLDSSMNSIYTTRISKNEKPSFSIAPLPAGSYRLAATVLDRYEFIPDTIQLHLSVGQIYELDTISLMDFTPPTIRSISAKDTIDISETLKFIIYDFGSGVSTVKTSVYFDNKQIDDVIQKGDTLFVPFKEFSNIKTWTYKFLSITATDYSNNKAKKNFYLRPNSSLPEVFQ